MGKYHRRGFLGLMAGLLGSTWTGSRAAAAEPPNPDNPKMRQNSQPGTQIRRYRADATILLFGMPVYRRGGVGGGQASVEQTKEGDATTHTLFFAGGSDAARAHGVHRIGWIREVVREANSVPVEARYFGVLTAPASDESLDHAKKAAAQPQSGPSVYNAVRGQNTPGDSRSAVAHFELSSAAQWFDRRLIEAAEAAFQENPEWRQTSWPKAGSQTPPTFLFELARLLREREPRGVGRYVYNEQEYRLEIDRTQRATAEDQAAGLRPVHGKIRNLRTGSQNTFTLWLDEASGSIVPIRIEYQPRSFLRLVFEAA